MKKAELETAYEAHTGFTRRAAKAEAERDYRSAIRDATESLSTLKLANAFHRRFIKTDRPPVAAVDMMLRLAPPLFARRSIDALEECVAGWKKPELAVLPGFAERITECRRGLRLAIDLWSALGDENTPPVGRGRSDSTATADILGFWVQAGLVVRVGTAGVARFRKVTDLRRDAWGKCPACGHAKRAVNADLLRPSECPTCRGQHPFVITKRVV